MAKFITSVVERNFRLRSCASVSGLVGSIITITITKTQIEKHSEKFLGSLLLGKTKLAAVESIWVLVVT